MNEAEQRLPTLMERSGWFLTAAERGNPATSIDRRHGDVAWTTGNRAEPLVHGRGYFAGLHDELSRTTAGDLVLFTDWRGDPDECLAGPLTTLLYRLVNDPDGRPLRLRVRRSY